MRASKCRSKSIVNKNIQPITKNISLDQLVEAALEKALDQKALDPVVFNLSESYNIAERILILSGTSVRHVKGIADKILSGLFNGLVHPDKIEGYSTGEWIIMDYSDLIIHIFFEPQRQYYELDQLLAKYPKINFREELDTKLRRFKTGLHPLS